MHLEVPQSKEHCRKHRWSYGEVSHKDYNLRLSVEWLTSLLLLMALLNDALNMGQQHLEGQ